MLSLPSCAASLVPLLFIISSCLGAVLQLQSHEITSLQCRGRRIFIYNLPPEFNTDLLLKCKYGITHWLNFCSYIANAGLGHPLEGSGLGKDWYTTDPYMLEIIFHSRMIKYPCLTDNITQADAIFVPYYTGIDALNYLYNSEGTFNRIPHGLKLVMWLEKHAQEHWQKYGGKDHFLIMGRTSWDFGISETENYKWGTGIAHLPHIANMTVLLIEKKPWVQNEQAIPYPTGFHPSQSGLQEWINNVRTIHRSFLFAFAGSIRPTMMEGAVRNILLEQCSEAGEKCALVDCKALKCSHSPEPIIRTFVRSTFCLQPRGDTPTRRSTFDSIISGCIPVLFHNDSAYTQYTWHLPQDFTTWSVYIPEEEIKKGTQVENVLRTYSEEKIWTMREKVISLLPKVIYANGNDISSVAKPADAFDISVQGVLKVIANIRQPASDA